MWGGPSAVRDQSNSRMRAPISPPPARNVSCEGSADGLFIMRPPDVGQHSWERPWARNTVSAFRDPLRPRETGAAHHGDRMRHALPPRHVVQGWRRHILIGSQPGAWEGAEPPARTSTVRFTGGRPMTQKEGARVSSFLASFPKMLPGEKHLFVDGSAYSLRKASVGSMRSPRRAGPSDARTPTRSMNAAAAGSTPGIGKPPICSMGT